MQPTHPCMAEPDHDNVSASCHPGVFVVGQSLLHCTHYLAVSLFARQNAFENRVDQIL